MIWVILFLALAGAVAVGAALLFALAVGTLVGLVVLAALALAFALVLGVGALPLLLPVLLLYWLLRPRRDGRTARAAAASS
jgi:hypothetical protein